jgi:DNA-binding transcriptional LysR family regulator
LLTAALEGLGIALLPDTAVRKPLADGSLIEVLPELHVVPGIVHVVFPSRRGLIPAVRSLIDALVAGFEAFDKQ